VNELLESAPSHWPFIAAALIFWALGNASKRLVTKKMAAKYKLAWIYRATMPGHPVAAGALLGYFVTSLPVSAGVTTPGGRALYFALAGVFCAWVFDWLKHYAASRGVTLKPPEPSMPPEPPAQ
jgi:hypothetical protein